MYWKKIKATNYSVKNFKNVKDQQPFINYIYDQAPLPLNYFENFNYQINYEEIYYKHKI